jgi:hypothetical protein
MYLKYYLFTIVVTLMLAIAFRKSNRIASFSFIGYLVATILVEISAIIIKEKFEGNNLWLYNIFILATYLCWFLWFNNCLSRNRSVSFVTSVFIIFGLLNIFFLQKIDHLNSYTFLLGSVCYVYLFFNWIANIFKDDSIRDDRDLIIFFAAGLGYFTGFLIDILLFPSGKLNRIIYRDWSIDDVLVGSVNTYYYGLLCIAILIGYRIGNNKNDISDAEQKQLNVK